MKNNIRKLTLTALMASAMTSVSFAQDSEEIVELQAYVVQGVEDFAARAVEGVTPVSFSTVDVEQMQMELGSRDLPMVLETTPSVYASQDGGGAGDARINVRGFNQRNVAVLINGIPQNDMENGWVYWSNWDGVADTAESVQVQRGMSNVNLATPSVGGTLNIITNPAGQNMGGVFKQEFGSGNFLKTSVTAHTGLMLNDKLAVSAALIRKTGDGIIDKTWTDAWAYYVGATYVINDQNRLDFTFLGAPQRHGQNLYDHNVAEYDQDFARKIGADPASFDTYPEQGRDWNENWSPITKAYKGKQSFNGKTESRYADDYIMERENYFHKPLASLNWAWEPSDALSVYTAFYWSGGEGGGTGTYYVSRAPDGTRYPYGRQISFRGDVKGFGAYQYDAQANYDQNVSNPDGNSTSILRNSVNVQNTWGAISKATYTVSDELVIEAGLDWRSAWAKHYREVRDLLGGQYFWESNAVNDNWDNEGPMGGFTKVYLGDKIAYNTKNTIDWLGAYVQAEYTNDKWTAFGMFGTSSIEYGHTNYFKTNTGLPGGGDVEVNPDAISGYQTKGGVLYNVTDEVAFYANAGHYDNAPILDGIIDDSASIANPDPKNEKFTNFEVGVNYSNKAGTLAINADVYSTKWEDRTVTRTVDISQDEQGLATITGLNQEHAGVEIEGTYMPTEQWRFDAAVSLNKWEYSNDVSSRVRSYDNPNDSYDLNLYLDGLKVGDAPQKQFVLRSTYKPFDGFSASLVGKWNGEFYAEFNPEDRDDANDRAQSWETPDFWVWDLHLNYNTTYETSWAVLDVTYFVHVFNLMDETYINEATDNDGYNAFDFDHDADDAGVKLGLPRNFNAGVKIRF